MIDELNIIRAAFTSPDIGKATPFAHLIPDRDDGDCFGDSSLKSAGGWSIPMRFWWWIAWPEKYGNVHYASSKMENRAS